MFFKRPSPWFMWISTLCFVFFQFFLQLSAGVMVNQFMQSFSINAFGAGLLAASFYIVYVVLQTPAGVMVDYFGPRRLLFGGALLCGLGCLLFSYSPNLTIAFLARMMMGAGASFAYVSSLYLAAEWFPAQRFAVMVGLAETIGMLGVLLGNFFLASFLQYSNWRDAMFFSAWVACALGLLCWIFVRDRATPDNPVANQSLKLFFPTVKWALKQSILWLNGIYAGLMFSIVTVFASLWSMPFLMLAQNVSLPVVSLETAMVFAGVALGSPLAGWVFPYLKDSRPLMTAAPFLSMLLVLWIVYFTPHSVIVGGLLFFILGALCGIYILSFSLAVRLASYNSRTTIVGLTNALCMVTSPLLQSLVGGVLRLSGGHRSILEVSTQLAIFHYREALIIVPIGLLIATCLARQLTLSHFSKEQGNI